VEQKKRIEEEVKKTLIEATATVEKVETKEKSTVREIKEREISITKQKEEIKRTFEKQITTTKKECYSCDNGVHKLVKDRGTLDRIKAMEKAAGGFMPKGSKPLSKKELMDAMRAILKKRQEKKAANNQFAKETNQVIVEKKMERQLKRQSDQIQTLKYQVKKSMERTE
jgi:hypothetical protein